MNESSILTNVGVPHFTSKPTQVMHHSEKALRKLTILALERELLESVREIDGLCIIVVDGEEVMFGKDQAVTFLRAILRATNPDLKEALL